MLAAAPVLIAEDNLYVALDLSNAIEDMAGRVVGPVSSVSEALFLLNMQYVAAAIVDCTLSDRDAAPLAWQLRERGIPFVIHTAAPVPEVIAELHPEVPVLSKPLQPRAVLARLLIEMRRSARHVRTIEETAMTLNEIRQPT
ncbi:MAG: response regulator [Pseudomonadota bacterium]